LPEIDGLVKSFTNVSFRASGPLGPTPQRAKPEIFLVHHVVNIGFLPAVEMTDSLSWTFYETITIV